jgi:hypothetical protein
MHASLERYAPLTGVAFLPFVIAMILIPGETPGDTDSTAIVIRYWAGHDTEQIVASIIGAYAALLLVWFAGSVRTTIAKVEEQGRLAALALVGGVIAAVGLLTLLAVQFVAANTVGDVPALTTQTLSVLATALWFGIAAGLGLMLVAAGLAAIRYGWLRRWAAWVTLILGVLTASPAIWPTILIVPFWIAGLGVALFRIESAGLAPPTVAAPPAPPRPAQPAL